MKISGLKVTRKNILHRVMTTMQKKGSCHKANKRCRLILLQVLCKLKGSEQSEILHHLSEDAINSICEALYNISYSPHLKVDKKAKNKIRKLLESESKAYKYILNKKNPINCRRKKLKSQSSCGSLNTILGAAIPYLCEIVNKSRHKKIHDKNGS